MTIPNTLPDILIRAATKYPDHGIGYIKPDKSINIQLYPELLDNSRRILAGLKALGLEQGDKVILSLDTDEEIIPTLWACFQGGIIPALLQPPLSFSEYNPAAEKAEKVFRLLSEPHVILSHDHYDSWVKSNIPDHRLIDISSVSLENMETTFPEIKPADLALIQFSSGSTGDPKGVMLSHQNIISNIIDIIDGIKLTREDVSVSWMPLYHDMGLVGFHITPTMTGCKQFFIEPADFVKNPSLYLDMLSEQKCDITGCPNFGQALVNRYINRRKNPDWNFSGIRVVFNGAEPISTLIMNEFISNLAQFGFRSHAMFPAYGLAEATLAVTFAPLENEAEVVSFQRTALLKEGVAILAEPDDTNGIELVNLGSQLEHCEIRIVDDNDETVSPGYVGNVQVSGENVSQGYFNNAAVISQAFSGRWLRTGDLGFIYNGNLFITGRSKDIIFIASTHFYAHDLESVILQLEEVKYGRIVISGYFNEDEGRDKLLVFLIGSDNESTREIFRKMKNHLLKTVGLNCDTFIPIRSNDIPRTSSGKIQRYKMVNRFLRGEFKVIKLSS